MRGVYILTVNSDPHYVGECVNLSRRFNGDYGNISPKTVLRVANSRTVG
jgi:hypothetical protein